MNYFYLLYGIQNKLFQDPNDCSLYSLFENYKGHFLRNISISGNESILTVKDDFFSKTQLKFIGSDVTKSYQNYSKDELNLTCEKLLKGT